MLNEITAPFQLFYRWISEGRSFVQEQKISSEEDRFFSIKSLSQVALSAIGNISEIALNQTISDVLPSVQMKQATLSRTKEGQICFTFFADEAQQVRHFFPDEVSFQQWFFGRSRIDGEPDIWEVEDALSECPQLLYCYRKESGEIEEGDLLIILQELSRKKGPFFRVEDSCASRSSRYFLHEAKGLVQGGIVEIPFNHLLQVVQRMEEQNAGTRSRAPTNINRTRLVKAVFLGSLFFWAGKTFTEEPLDQTAGSLLPMGASPLSVAATIHLWSVRNGFSGNYLAGAALLGSQLWNAGAVNAPPQPVEPPLTIQVSPGEIISIPNLQNKFHDPNGDTLDITVQNRPSFLAFSKTLTQSVATIPGPGTLDIQGSFLYRVANYPPYFQIWNIEDIANPVLEGQVNVTGYGGVDGNYAFVVGSSFQVIDIQNPTAPVLAGNFSLPIVGARGALVDAQNHLVWVSGNAQIYAVDVSNPLDPQLAGVLNGTNVPNENNFMSFGSPNLLLVPYNDLGGTNRQARIVSRANPTNPVLVGNTSNPSAILRIVQNPDNPNIIHVVESQHGVSSWNISDPQNPAFISRTTYGLGLVFRNFQPGGFYSYLQRAPGGAGSLSLIDPNSQVATTFSFGGSTGNAMHQIKVEGNRIYLSSIHSDGSTRVYDINRSSLQGTPGLQHRGSYNVTITANDGRGGTANYSISIDVTNQDPVISQQIPDQFAEEGKFFVLNVQMEETFTDPEGDSLTLSILDRPAWMNFIQATTYGGTPGMGDIGETLIQLLASDPYGGSVAMPVKLTVFKNDTATVPPGTTVGSNNVQGSENQALLVALPVGLGTLILFCVGGGIVGYVYKRKLKELSLANLQEDNQTFMLSTEYRSCIKTVFGGNKYAFLDFKDKEEKIRAFKKVGIPIVDEEGKFAEGNFGSIYLCWSLETKQYMVAKVISTPRDFADSIKEAAIQRKASDEGSQVGIWPITHTIQDDDQTTLIHLMPVAELGNLNDLRKLMRDLDKESDVPLLTRHIASAVITGCHQGIHGRKLIHSDLKGANVLVGKKRIGITDFGCSLEVDNIKEPLGFQKSDWRYQSPDRLFCNFEGNTYRGDQDDAWAIGAILLEFLTGESIQTLFNLPSNRRALLDSNKLDTLRQHYQTALDKIEQLKNPDPNSIWVLVKNLLKVDASRRLTLEAALRYKCLSNVKAEEGTEILERLFDGKSRRMLQRPVEQENRRISGSVRMAEEPAPLVYNNSTEEPATLVCNNREGMPAIYNNAADRQFYLS